MIRGARGGRVLAVWGQEILIGRIWRGKGGGGGRGQGVNTEGRHRAMGGGGAQQLNYKGL
jgi:hypothetical protein